MDLKLHGERTRINKIFSKFACNYTSPVSLAKDTLNKLTRHRKVYSYDADTVKESESNIRSMKVLLDRTINRCKDDKGRYGNREIMKKHKINSSAQQIFPFQSEFSQMRQISKVFNEASDKSYSVKSRRHYFSEMKKNQVLRRLPSLSEYSTNKNIPTFMRVASKKILMSDRPPHRNSFESEIKPSLEPEDYFNKNKEKFEEIIGVEIKSKPLDMLNLKHPKSERSYLALPVPKARVLHVVLPRSLKGEANESAYSNYAEIPLKGWDRITPFDKIES